MPRREFWERDRRGSRAKIAIVLAVSFWAGAALADRPPEALEAEQKEQAVALQYLIRKTDSLSSQLVERRSHLRKRVRAMYKMSQGGYLRLLLGADSPGDLFAKRDAADRILRRDVEELQAVREELTELKGMREKLREGERRAAELAVTARETRPEGLARKDAIMRPVDGILVRGFGPYRDPASGLEFSSDGLVVATRAGQPVFAPASGAVRSLAETPGLGLAMVIDHGDGWMTLLGHLENPEVRIGARVRQGYAIAQAAGTSVEFQLSQGGTWLDPSSWLLHAPLRPDQLAPPVR